MEGLVTAESTNYVEWIPKLCKIFAKISPSTPERQTFLENAIRWTANKNGRQGHPFLHQVNTINNTYIYCIFIKCFEWKQFPCSYLLGNNKDKIHKMSK